MFSVRRFDPTAGTSQEPSNTSGAQQHGQNGPPLDPLSRLNARLEAQRKGALGSFVRSTSAVAETESSVLACVKGAQPTNDDGNSIAETNDPTPGPSQPITKKQKARIELGLTGANSIPLPSLEGPKPKTSAKLKYLKRKKQRGKAKKKSMPHEDKKQIKQELRDLSADPSQLGTDAIKGIALDVAQPEIIFTEPPAKPDATIQDGQVQEDEITKPKRQKRPKNLDVALEVISKKKRKKDTASASPAPETAKNAQPEDVSPVTVEPTQPGALPRFPAPVNPTVPNPQLLARLAMGLRDVVEDGKDDDEDLVQLDSQSSLNLSDLKVRGELGKFTEALALSQHSISRLRELEIQSLLAVQVAVFSILMPPLSACLDTPAALVHPVRRPPRDICVSAPTGSGKTLSYIVPIVETLSSRVVVRLRALIVLPTRDLVLQVKSAFDSFSKGTGLKSAIITGQHSFVQEQAAISSTGDESSGAVDVVIATPGRLVDHLNHTPGFSLQYLSFLVLDEADQLLNKSQSWLHQVLAARGDPSQNRLIESSQWPERTTPKDTKPSVKTSTRMVSQPWTLPIETHNPCRSRPFRVLLFSATLRRDPTKLAHLDLRRPMFLKISRKVEDFVDELNAYTLPSTLAQYMVVTTTTLKPLVFFHLIKSRQITKGLCFCKSVEGATRLASLYKLMADGETGAGAEVNGTKRLGKAACFSSELKAGQRKKMLMEFQTGNINLLICSDVIARGLDIPSVQHVINYDSPVDARKYVHRVGRTARAGEVGKAWSLVESQEAKYLKDCLKTAMGEEVWKGMQRIRIRRPDVEYLAPVYETALKELAKIFGRTGLNLDSM